MAVRAVGDGAVPGGQRADDDRAGALAGPGGLQVPLGRAAGHRLELPQLLLPLRQRRRPHRVQGPSLPLGGSPWLRPDPLQSAEEREAKIFSAVADEAREVPKSNASPYFL